MLAAFKTEAKQSNRADVSSFKARRAPGRSSSTSPTTIAAVDGRAKQEPLKLGKMQALLAQPYWATHLQSLIANVTEPNEQQQLRFAMLQFSQQNADHTADFLRHQHCRLVEHPVLCSIGRCDNGCCSAAHHDMIARFHGAYTGSVARASGPAHRTGSSQLCSSIVMRRNVVCARSDVLLAGAPHGYGSFAFVVSKTSHFVFNGKSLIPSPVHANIPRAHVAAPCQ
jgi:hypothetical protein